MENGFYRVKEAPRWGGYSHADRIGRFEAEIREMKTFNGQAGFLDDRMLELRDPKKQDNAKITSYFESFYHGLVNTGGVSSVNPAYSIPLIFRNELVRASGIRAGFFASFFNESEIEMIDAADAAKMLSPMSMRRYGDLAVMPTRMQREVWEIRGVPVEEVESLEEIPLYLPATSKQEIEEMISSDRALNENRTANRRRRDVVLFCQN